MPSRDRKGLTCIDVSSWLRLSSELLDEDRPMNAPTNIQPANSPWSEKRFGADTRHSLPRNPDSAIDHIPGEDGMPVLGHTLEQLRDYPAFTRPIVAKDGRVYRTNSFAGRSAAPPPPETHAQNLYHRHK